MLPFASLDELRATPQAHLGHSRWRRIDQPTIDAFAELTGDRQWIHVDPRRAAAGPYGAPVAHGFLLLALLPVMLTEVLRVRGIRMAVNYGLDRVRFPAPVRVGGEIRADVHLVDTTEVGPAVQGRCRVTVEVAGGDKPCCVAETIFRFS